MSYNRIWNMNSILDMSAGKDLYLNFLTFSEQGNADY